MAARPTDVPAPGLPARTDAGLDIAMHAPWPMIVVIGARHIVREINPAFCQLIGKSREDVIGKPFGEAMAVQNECQALLERVLLTGKPESHTLRETSDAASGFWSYTMWPVMVDDRPRGVVIQVTETEKEHVQTRALNEALVMGSLRQHELMEASENANARMRMEVAERKQAEAALRASEERYRNLFNSIDEGFCVVEMLFDANGLPVDYRFLQVNPSFEKQTGLHNAVGKRIREMVPEFEAHWYETYGRVALTGEPVRFVAHAKGLNGAWFDVYAFRVGEPKKRQVAILFNAVTERKRAEAALQKSEQALRKSQEEIARHSTDLEKVVAERTAELTVTNRQLEAFVYSIAHDLRAPLRSMQGFSDLLVEEAGGVLSATGRDFAQRISRSAQFMDALLSDLLAFSRISQREVQLSPVGLGPVMDGVILRLQKDFSEAGARVENMGPWPVVLAHEATLSQVIFNLVANAVKFVRPGVPPLVRLRAEEQEDLVRVWVEDNGPGIAPDHQGQIFRIFLRLDGDKYPGTGIGLAIVEKGVERMGGRAGVDSTPGQGSRFWIELKKGENKGSTAIA